MAEVVKLKGLEGVRRALRRLPKELREKELDKAVFAGAKIVRDAAKSLAPSGDDGAFVRQLRGKTWNKKANNLRDSIAIRKEKKKFKKDAARRRVGVLWSNRDPNVGAWYWRFVEFDHVAAGRGKTKGKHIPARPFLVPAFEAVKYLANEAIKEKLLKGVSVQAAKVKGGPFDGSE